MNAAHGSMKATKLLVGVVRGEICEFVFLELGPDAFVRVVFEAVGRKAFDGQARVSGDDGADVRTFVLGGAVPKQDDVTLDVPKESAEKPGDVVGLEALLDFDVEVHAFGGADDADQADFLPFAEVVSQMGRFSARRPSLPDKRRQAGSRFVEEPDGATSFRRVFFASRQVARNFFTFAGSNSRGFRSGFCHEKSRLTRRSSGT